MALALKTHTTDLDGPSEEFVRLERSRGAAFVTTKDGALQRIDPVVRLLQRGLLSEQAVIGAREYGADFREVFGINYRSTLEGRSERGPDDELMSRFGLSWRTLISVRAAVFRGNSRMIHVADEICGHGVINKALEREAKSGALSRLLEGVARWYDNFDRRAESRADSSAMRRVEKEAWRILARVFNRHMSDEAFEELWISSGMAQYWHEIERRQVARESAVRRMRSVAQDMAVNEEAERMWNAHAERTGGVSWRNWNMTASDIAKFRRLAEEKLSA